MKSIFFSHNFPTSLDQRRLVSVTENWITAQGHCCLTARELHNSTIPVLEYIRSLIESADHVVVMAFQRFEHQAAADTGVVATLRQSSPWVHMEAAMAFQLDKPVLLLKENLLSSFGMFDEVATGISVTQFSISCSDSEMVQLLENENLLAGMTPVTKAMSEGD